MYAMVNLRADDAGNLSCTGGISFHRDLSVEDVYRSRPMTEGSLYGVWALPRSWNRDDAASLMRERLATFVLVYAQGHLLGLSAEYVRKVRVLIS
jgi:hypothetical protein